MLTGHISRGKQILGDTIGYPFSPIIAELETEALNSYEKKPTLSLRHVDVHICHLTTWREVTTEKKENNCLPFLNRKLITKIDHLD